MIEEPQAEYSKDDLERIGKRWLDKIQQAEKREDQWIKAAEGAEASYLVDGEVKTDYDIPAFNILHSNIETIVPSIFNSTPKPEMRARYGLVDGPAKDVAEIYERVITTLIDDNRLDTEIEAEAQDAYLAGRGIVRVKFDADVEDIPEQIDPMTGELIPATKQVTNETVKFENVSWRDYREGPAKREEGVPWVSFRHEVSSAERERLENPDMAAVYRDDNNPESEDQDMDSTIWEIWCKEKKEVLFVIEGSGKVLDIQPDPLGLKGFFPRPDPAVPIKGTGKRTPVCPYTVYKTLADELDKITKRINKIMSGLKVRGAIAGDAEAIELISTADDNELVPVPNIEGLVAAGGLAKAVMWWPIDTAIQVLRELYAQREQTKQSIYEITGISDIVRGASNSGETATAQKIKTEWGSLRIKKMQRLIERQVRDVFSLTTEIIATKFSVQTIQQMCGMQITPEMQQLINDPLSHYRIDVETDSTVRADLTKSRGEMSEFLRGTAEFFSTMAPIVQSSPQAAGPLARMYAAFASQFNLGKSASDALDQFVQMAEEAAKQPQQDPEAEQMKAEMQFKMDEAKGKMMLEVEKLKLQNKGLGLDAQIKEAELQIKREDLDLKEAEAEVKAISNAVEMELERTQERPVKVGN